MIYLHTGLPGHGKTLLTLAHVLEIAKAEFRPVFYSGIEILKPELFEGWELLESGEDWHKCPPGSIVILDECQRVFRPRGNGSAVPVHVEMLETHRHSGIDLYCITQHPMLVDTNLRRLVGLHRHYVRPFGMPFATMHEFQAVNVQCEKIRKDSIEHRKPYPKELFDAYKSAEVHTHKSRIPARVFLLPLLPIALLVIGWLFYSWWADRLDPEATEARIAEGAAAALGAPVTPPRVGSSGSGKEALTFEEWLHRQQPRLAGFSYTAPMYDKLTDPSRVPVPAACIKGRNTCRCWSQDATPLTVPEDSCLQIVAGGLFLPFDPEGRKSASAANVEEGRKEVTTDGDSARVSMILNSGTYGGIPLSIQN